jgi:hypothetical protein
MARANKHQTAANRAPTTTTRSAKNVNRQFPAETAPKVLKAGKAKMSEMEPGAILEISDEAARKILEHRASLK